MQLCIFLLAISFIMLIVAIIIYKKAISIKTQIDEQFKSLSEEPQIFLDFFKND